MHCLLIINFIFHIFYNYYPCKGAIAYGRSRYGPGKGPVYLDDVACAGSENILANCTSSHFGDVGSNCRSHFQDASVFCPSRMQKTRI